MKNKENWFNYSLSIGFVFLLLIFVAAIIGITKYSLSDQNVVKDHVKSTKNLIEDISEVEKSVEHNEENLQNNINTIKYSNFNEDIKDTSFLNIKNNKSIISIVFDSQIETYQDIYYLKQNKNTKYKKDDILLYKTSSLPQIGVIISENPNQLVFNILNFETQKIQEIESNQIIGKIIMKYG